MKIGLDARMIRITGIGRYLEELAQGLTEIGVDVTVMLRSEDIDWWTAAHPGIKHILTPEPIYSWSEQLVLPARLRRENFDLIHFGNFNVPVSWSDRFVVTIHDLIPLTFAGERKTSWVSRQAYQRVLSHGLKKSDRIIVPSLDVMDKLCPIADPKKIAVIPHGLGQVFRTRPDLKKERMKIMAELGVTKPFVLYVGNYRSHKNVATLVQAFSGFNDGQSKAQLVLAGEIKRTQRMALSTLGGESQQDIIFTGKVDTKKLLALYDSARIFALPSFMEGFGLPALEAAARRVPVIASTTIPVREFLGGAVTSFDPRSASSLAKQIEQLWPDSIMRDQKIRNAKRRAIKRSWQDVAKETAQVYQEVGQYMAKK